MKANKTRKVHTQEFKAEALKLAERIGVAAAARELLSTSRRTKHSQI